MKASGETAAWRQYEAGRDYKRRIGLYETVRTNERFYRGDQWKGISNYDLPRPVFNIVRRIADYLICNVAADDLTVTYTDENLPYITDPREAALISEGVAALNGNAAYRWKHEKIASLIYRIITDAALSGDGVVYCWWDPDRGAGGDIVTEAIDNVNLFVADMNRACIQEQDTSFFRGVRRCARSEPRQDAREFPSVTLRAFSRTDSHPTAVFVSLKERATKRRRIS